MTFKTWLENSEGGLREFPSPIDPKIVQPTMGRRTDSQSADHPPGFIDPDTLYRQKDAETASFIYTSSGHLIIGDNENVTHAELGGMYPELRAIKDRQDDVQKYRDRDNLAMECLLGRISDYSWGRGWGERQVVSFWNSPADLVPLIKPCLQELRRRHLVFPLTELHHPKIQTTTVGEYLNGKGRAQTDPEVERRAEMARKLHILPADQKRAAMKKLGLGTMGKPNPWRDAMRRAGLPAGSSHRFPTSEGT